MPTDPRSDAEARYDALVKRLIRAHDMACSRRLDKAGQLGTDAYLLARQEFDDTVVELAAELRNALRADAPPGDAEARLDAARARVIALRLPRYHRDTVEAFLFLADALRASAPRQETQGVRLSGETKAQIEVWCMDVERGTHQGAHVAESIIEVIEHPERLSGAAPPPEEGR